MDEYNDHRLNVYLNPLSKAWVQKFKRAREAKKDFQDIADQCRTFFKGGSDFWKSSSQGGCYGKYMDEGHRPTIRMTMSKAFELVALFGPMLYHRNPQRFCQPRKSLPVIPGVFPLQQGVPPEQAQQMRMQMAQQAEQQIAEKLEIDKLRAEVTETVLNYMPTEQPGGGLYGHSRLAISEALITGRGCLWTELYSPPGSDQTLTGSFFDSVDNLLIDSGATKPDLSDAFWISKKECRVPSWKVEREYQLRPGSLKGTGESAESMSEMTEHEKSQMRRDGDSNDVVTYYKVWSKTGVGFRFQGRNPEGLQNEYLKKIDEVVGDHAFLVIVPGIPYPLNMPPERLQTASTEEIKQAFSWPVEHYKDSGWPVQLLDLYKDHKSVWPIAPLRPAIGPIVFVNLMMSIMAERGVDGTKDIIGVAKHSFDEVAAALDKSGTRVLIPIDGVNKSLRDMLEVWKSSPVNFDVWRIIDSVMHEIERITGLTDFLQGMQQTQDRSAAASTGKQQQMQLRPDDMSMQVESWQTRAAAAERHALHRYVRGKDLKHLLGDYGAWLWDTQIVPLPLEVILRETDVTIEAGSVRKPNKAREAENMQNMSQVVLPMFQQYHQATGDPRQLNAWIKRMAKSIDLEGADLEMPPPPPPPPQQQGPDPEQQAAQAQAQAQMQQAQMQMQADREKHGMGMQQMQAEAQQAQMNLYIDQMKAKASMEEERLSAEVARQEMLMRLQTMKAEAEAPKPATAGA